MDHTSRHSEQISRSKIQVLLDEPVLIIEDSEEIAQLYSSYCKRLGIDCEIAENGVIGLEKANKKSYSLYIVDLMMPIMDGKTFVQKLKEIQPEAYIIIETSIDESEEVIDIMKMGVVDYLIKPILPNPFFNSIKKAAEKRLESKTEKEIEGIETQQLRNQLDWLTFKESQRKSSRESWEISSLYSLKTSLSQGSGIGALITLLDMLKLSQKDAGSEYLVNKETLDLIYMNQQVGKNILSGISDLLDIVHREPKFITVRASELLRHIKDKSTRLSPIFKSKNVTLNFPEIKSDPPLDIELESFSMATDELLLNACKYCISDTSVDLFATVVQGYFCIAVKNIVEKVSAGIEEKFENLVVQPFFRVLPPVEEAADFERFGLGLGLTAVDYITHKHNGMFFIHNAKDHTTNSVRLSVLAEIFLPLNHKS
ncbi:response regulator receiver domain protein [Leptospira broomii serovar Hurstbridge str. 5399]|uniref:Response regulator receiver domain protein n=1 Tax=Leptospira broomii serovar Hurstbridge str. 5399 TaxID=1049789 RepID=T0GE85_9LEPT|nr:response regulator [Leptospira broomii]EQA45119.1 response regulator receiver domain protein [Leptospira broomii serovar Hurstbridge str. 5399]